MAEDEFLEQFKQSRPRGIFLDFDGTLSEIVSRPEQARPLPQVRPLLAELAERYELVSVISGRPREQVEALLDVDGVEVFGHYGIERGPSADLHGGLRGEVQRAIANVEGAWVEDKGASLAVHYRAAPEPAGTEARLRPSLQAIADRHGLILLLGKKVVELAPADTPGKGMVILREARARGMAGCLFAGDDQADLTGFHALDQLRADGLAVVKVAVRSEETPADLVEAADVVVERPDGLLELLGRL
jgi:trehalose 6-phosphate phosphatase